MSSDATLYVSGLDDVTLTANGDSATLRATEGLTVVDGSVTTEKLADGAVTTSKIANNSVTSEKIADGAVDTSDIASNAVTEAKIADNAVGTKKLKDSAITTAKLVDRSVTTAKLADKSVTLAKMADGSIDGSKLVNGSVTGNKIADSTIRGGSLQDGAISDYKLSQVSGQVLDRVRKNTEGKVPWPTGNESKLGEYGQVLRTNGDGTTRWEFEHLPPEESMNESVRTWLDEHPEATTTVQDGSLTEPKLMQSFSLELCRCFDVVSDMQDATNLKSGMICHTNGFHIAGDGGAAYYVVTSTGPANDMDILALQNGLFATLAITEPYVTPEMFGAWGDGTTIDTESLRKAINAGNIKCSSAKTYLIDEPIILNSYDYDFCNSTILAYAPFKNTPFYVDGSTVRYVLLYGSNKKFNLSNLIVDGNKSGNGQTNIIGIEFYSCNGNVNNVTIQKCYYHQLLIHEASKITFNNIKFLNLGSHPTGSDVYSSGTNIPELIFNGVHAERNDADASITTGQVFYINSGDVLINGMYAKDCYLLVDARKNSTVLQNAISYGTSHVGVGTEPNSINTPPNVTYKNVYFYDMKYRQESTQSVLCFNGVDKLCFENVYMEVGQFVDDATITVLAKIMTDYGRINKNIYLNNVDIKIKTNINSSVVYGLYTTGNGTIESFVAANCTFELPEETANSHAIRLNAPIDDSAMRDCDFINFTNTAYYPTTYAETIKMDNATVRRCATTDLPTLTIFDTGAIVYDTTASAFKIWNGTSWAVL